MRSQSQYQRASMSNTFPVIYSFPNMFWSSYSEHASLCYISQLSRVLSLGYIKVKKKYIETQKAKPALVACKNSLVRNALHSERKGQT